MKPVKKKGAGTNIEDFIQQLDFEQSYLNQTNKTHQMGGGDILNWDNVGKNVMVMIKDNKMQQQQCNYSD